jgi:hypothetical protein
MKPAFDPFQWDLVEVIWQPEIGEVGTHRSCDVRER